MEELEITEGASPEQNPREQSAPPEAEPESAPAAEASEPAAEDAAEPETEPEAEPEPAQSQVVVMEAVEADDLLAAEDDTASEGPVPIEDAALKAVMEALVYVAEEPITVAQVAASLSQPADRIRDLFGQLIAEFDKPEHGVQIREVAGGYRMATKAEHHDAVRTFVKSLKPPLKLSLPALETLAVIAYKQPVTAPEIKEIRGVQGTGVLSTLLDRKLIAEAGRKNVIGKPILYKTTKEFLLQFGLKDLAELPTLKEFEEIRRMAFADSEPAEPPQAETAPAETPVVAETTAVVESPGEPVKAEALAEEKPTSVVNEAGPEQEAEVPPAEAAPAPEG